MRRSILLFGMVFCLTGLCAADSFIWTDTTSGVPGTVYQLVTNTGCTSSCTANLSITTTNVANTYIGWLNFHLNSGNAASITSLTGFGSDAWTVANGITVPWGNNGASTQSLPGNGGWSAIYASGLQTPTGDFTTNGLLLNGTIYTTSFSFNWSGNSGTLNSAPSLQVGYYLGTDATFKTTQMSQKPDQQVPEPATVSLMAAGLMGLFGARRLYGKL